MKAECLRQGALVVKQQAVFTPAGERVQGKAYVPEQVAPINQGLVFLACQEVPVNQLFK